MGETLVVLYLVGLVLAILWICLPFAVFGTKPKLDRIISEATTTNQHLAKLVEHFDTMLAQQRAIVDQQRLLLTRSRTAEGAKQLPIAP
jgi:hypothetical protein